MTMNAFDLGTDVDVTDADLDAMETIEVDGNLDAWMNDMLSGSSTYDY